MSRTLSMDHAISPPLTAGDPDRPLLARVAADGDRQALDDLLQRHAEAMWRVALRLCGGRAADAEDVVQEACLACLGSARHFAGRGSVRSWILALTANAARRQLRAAGRRRRHEAQVPVPASEPDSGADDEVMREAARQGLGHLDQGFRQVLELRYLDGLDDAAIAAVLGLREATVRTRSHRGLARLRDWLGRRGFAVGTAALIAALTPAQAALLPASLPALISTAAATGKGTVAALSASWSLGKITLAVVAALVVTCGGAWLLRPDPRLVLDGQELASAPMDAILAQPVTVHLDEVEVPLALEALRVALPLGMRPDVIVHPRLGIRGGFDPRDEPEPLALTCAVAADGLPLRETLDRLCASAGLRWWSGADAIVIDLPATVEQRRREDAAFQGHSDAETAAILIDSADALALRPLLLALGDARRAPAAVATLGPWMDRQVRFDRGRTVLARFAEDAGVHAALAVAIRTDRLPRVLGIHLAGQVRLPGMVTGCLALAEAGRRPRDPVEQMLRSSLRQDLGMAAVRALGWVGDARAVEPLIAVVADPETEDGLERSAIKALANLDDARAVDTLLARAQPQGPAPDWWDPTADLAALALVDFADPRIVPALASVMNDSGFASPNRSTAARALGSRGGEDALAALAAAVDARDKDAWTVQLAIAETMVLHEGPVADAIIRDLLAHSAVGSSVAGILARRSRPALLPILADRLRNGKVRGDAYGHLVVAIAAIGGAEAEDLLLDTLPRKGGGGAFWSHCRALAGTGPRADAALIVFADDADAEVRHAVANCLVFAGDAGRERLWRLIDEDPEPNVRRIALQSCDLVDARNRTRWPSTWWDRWLGHRHADVRAEAARQLASNPDRFEAADWLRRMDGILADPAGEVRAAAIRESSASGWGSIYDRDAARWRSSLDLVRTDPAVAVRLAIAEAAFYLTFPQVRLTRADQALLCDALVQAAQSDADPRVRAQVGLALGRILRVQGDELSVGVRGYLERLQAQEQAETDPRTRAVLRRILTDPDPLHVDLDWPKDPSPVTRPATETVDDF